MAPDVDADLLSRLSERGAQERSVLRVMPAAREADLTGPRVALALSTFAEEDLETFGAFPQDDHHRGRGFLLLIIRDPIGGMLFEVTQRIDSRPTDLCPRGEGNLRCRME